MSRSRSAAVVALDGVLFAARSWFAIDATNRRVPAVVVPTLEAGLSLVGDGGVAAVVGRLREEVRVVDVDLAGDRGDTAAAAITDWCAREGLWHLVRPSGGGPGRAHVFVAHEGRLAELHRLVDELRGRLHAPATGLDVRATVRPLSSPHRSGASTTARGRLSEALTALRRHPWARQTPKGACSSPVSRDGGVEALSPARRRLRTALPPQWAGYLEHGTAPTVGGPDQTRSAVELVATAALLRAGHDVTTAWDAVTGSHPDAFTRARASKRRWIRWVWNAAVESDNAFAPTPRADPPIASAVADARARLTQLAWSLPPRQRPSLLLVGHTVLDRIERTNDLRIPVPERDLVLDTGITDRKTIRAQLRALHGPVGVLHTDTLDRTRRSDTSFEFDIPTIDVRSVSQIPPPCIHTPDPPAGTWSALPPGAHQLWRALLRERDPVDLDHLAQRALLTSSSTDDLSPRQARTTRAALTALAEAGLAHCTATGQWIARATPTAGHTRRTVAGRAVLEQAVAAERAAYRAPGHRWQTARAAALKANYAREVGWWNGLPRDDRARRRATWQARFAALSVHDQEQIKADLAERRLRAGVDEPTRHDHWLDNLSWDDYHHRSTTRAAAFAALPVPLRQAHTAAWARHRARYNISRGTPLAQSRREHAAALPLGADDRDTTFLDAQLTLPGVAAAVS
ncbi:MAG: hypothetical protein ACRC35_00935 [Angustibacter sp.]